jgi:hypothetical protein
MEVDGNAGVFAINMTALGIESYTEAQMLSLVRQGYFEGMESAANVLTETSTDGIYTDIRTIDVSTELPDGIGGFNTIFDEITEDGAVIERTEETTFLTGTVINTTNFPNAKLNGAFIALQDDGTILSGIVDGGTTTTDAGTIRYELATPVTTTDLFKPFPPLATLEAGSYSSESTEFAPLKKYTTPLNDAATREDTHQYEIESKAYFQALIDSLHP